MMEDRNAEVVRLHLQERLSPPEIGARLGITRERVRQIVRKAGVSTDESRVIRQQRRDANRPRCECGAPRSPMAHLCLSCWKVNARRITDEELLADLNRLAGTLGHTPRLWEINELGKYCHVSYYRHFGSLQNAAQLAGLKPRGRGGRSHLKALERTASEGP